MSSLTDLRVHAYLQYAALGLIRFLKLRIHGVILAVVAKSPKIAYF